MQTYQTMKDSGVAWLGEIPTSWDLKRVGELFKQRNTKVSDKDYAPLSVTKNGIVPQLEDAAKTNDGDNRKLVLSGDYVINTRSDRKGSSGLSELNGSVSLINTVLADGKLHPRYTHHLLRSYPFQEEFYRWGQGIVADLWSTNYQRMKSIQLPVPDYETQKRIADYIDTETGLIDGLITKQQHLLKLLEEKRRATITQAVHRTIDTTEERIRDICTLNPTTETPFKKDDIVSFYPMESIGDDGTIDHSHTRVYSAVKTGYTVFQNGDVTMAKVTPCFENYKGAHVTDITSGAGFGTTELFVLRANGKVTPEYLYWLTQAQDFNDHLAGGMRGTGGLKRVVPEELKNYKVNIPTPEVQKKIVAELLEDMKKFDQLREKVVKQLDVLKERRTSLVAHVVTGKIKV